MINRISGLIVAAALLASPAAAEGSDSLLTIPGLADFATEAWKGKRIVGIVDFEGKIAGGGFLPMRTYHTGAGVDVAHVGIGGIIKQGESFRPRFMVDVNSSAILHRFEGGWGWYDRHTRRLKTPDVWIGPNIMLPMPGDRTTWKDFGSLRTWLPYIGASISLGI